MLNDRTQGRGPKPKPRMRGSAKLAFWRSKHGTNHRTAPEIRRVPVRCLSHEEPKATISWRRVKLPGRLFGDKWVRYNGSGRSSARRRLVTPRMSGTVQCKGMGMRLVPREKQLPNFYSVHISRFNRWNVGPSLQPSPGDHDSRIPISLQRSHRAPMPTTCEFGAPRTSLMSSNSYSRPNARKCAKRELKWGSERR
jgi:hypothetical protein